jgi:hypothetical protein
MSKPYSYASPDFRSNMDQSNLDSNASWVGTILTALTWLSGAEPAFVALSAIVTIGFTAHRWLVLWRHQRHEKEYKHNEQLTITEDEYDTQD